MQSENSTSPPQEGPASDFLGAWLVSESVYNADGSYAGVVHQRRELLQLEENRIRVIQNCEPQPALANHPMMQFSGKWVFDLEMAGSERRYLGPDVVGSGTVFGNQLILGRGIWPRFGHNFRSFAILSQSDRQLTGGIFQRATQPTAHIMGVATSEEASDGWPTFTGPWWPGAHSTLWKGTRTTCNPQGEIQSSSAVLREYSASDQSGRFEYSEKKNDESRHVSFHFETQRCSRKQEAGETLQNEEGFCVRYGNLWTVENISHDNIVSTWQCMMDATSNTAIEIITTFQHNQLQTVETTVLSPSNGINRLEN